MRTGRIRIGTYARPWTNKAKLAQTSIKASVWIRPSACFTESTVISSGTESFFEGLQLECFYSDKLKQHPAPIISLGSMVSNALIVSYSNIHPNLAAMNLGVCVRLTKYPRAQRSKVSDAPVSYPIRTDKFLGHDTQKLVEDFIPCSCCNIE
jgi:hypothetical protein